MDPPTTAAILSTDLDCGCATACINISVVAINPTSTFIRFLFYKCSSDLLLNNNLQAEANRKIIR
jgi:hypothetical protein